MAVFRTAVVRRRVGVVVRGRKSASSASLAGFAPGFAVFAVVVAFGGDASGAGLGAGAFASGHHRSAITAAVIGSAV